jgi:hypothetical protein
MNYEEAKKRVLAAQELLNEQATSRAKFESIRTLIRGINPRIDKALNASSKALTDLTKLQKGEVIELAAEHLPEDTDENKKRKKTLLLFIKFWKDLKGEVARVQTELEKGRHGQSSAQTIGRIASYAKGPIGLITLVAVGIAYLKFSEVEVVIKNRGCEPLQPIISMPVRIPGLSLPANPIPDGGQDSAFLPPVTFSVDGTRGNVVRLHAFGLKLDYELGGRDIDVVLNGESLIGKQSTADFGSQKQHELLVTCS